MIWALLALLLVSMFGGSRDIPSDRIVQDLHGRLGEVIADDEQDSSSSLTDIGTSDSSSPCSASAPKPSAAPISALSRTISAP